jgi:hypothetical protein
MANIDWTDMRWNGKLSWAVDLLYYDKVNVDITHPPYSWRDRNSSFFFRTRKWYQADWTIERYLSRYVDTEREIKDIKIVWEDTCTKNNWNVYYLCVSTDWLYKEVLIQDIIDWCADTDEEHIKWIGRLPRRWCTCWDDRLFTTTYVKWKPYRFLQNVDTKEFDDESSTWIQINRKEWWVVRGYMFDEDINSWEFKYAAIPVWAYVVAYMSTNVDGSWFCWQVRTVVWVSKWWEIMLNEPWLWFSDLLDDNEEVRWWWISYKIFTDWWDVVWFTSYWWVEVIVDPDNIASWERVLQMCDFHQWTWGCIISTTSDTNRMYFLYENGYIHYGGIWMNKFFSTVDDAIYAGKDKTSITIYRDTILAFWRKNIAVWLWDSTWQYAQMYRQSASIWLKNRYAYWEYNWDMLFVSNDNRLLALQFESNAWTHMLNFEDVWAYANPFLKAMLPTDEVYLWVDNNQLRIFINSRSSIDRDNLNSRTTILKYDTIFQTWTVDELKYFIIRWCYEWLYYWDSVYVRNWWEDSQYDSTTNDYIPREYTVHISAFLLENENNWMANEYGSADLFHLAALQKVILLLWTWRYTDELTKLKITEWRWWWGRQYEINCLENNDWVKMIWYAYNGEQLDEEFIKKKQCVLDSLNDGSKQIRAKCSEWHKIQDPIKQIPWCEFDQDVQFWEHNVCINDEIYELAPTMPLTINLWDQENYNSGIKLELISQNWDVINFWWFMAQLHFATLWSSIWWDWEYQIDIDTGC